MPEVVMKQFTPMVAELLNPSFDATAPLTPDALMIYCRTRLNGLDEQVNVALHKQQVANADAKVLTGLAQALKTPDQAVNTGCDGGVEYALGEVKKMLDSAKGITDPTTRAAVEKAAGLLLAKCQEGIQARISANKKGFDPPKAEDLLKCLEDGGGGQSAIETALAQCGPGITHNMSISEFKAVTTDAIQGIQKDANASTELSMISLQSLMSQRQSSVQLITNLVQALGDQANKIAANIGH